MRRHWITATALAVTLAAGLLQAPVALARAQKTFDIVEKTYVVKTRDAKIYVEIAHAAQGDKIVRAPSVFTYSPYSILGDRRNNDASEWTPQGYHRVWADVIGTGNSGGCYDYGGDREKRTAHDLVEWIAKQKWSTGKVGMFGASYEGTTATAAAVTKPKGLTTIVPEAAISRWYGYAYSGGIRYLLNNEQPADEGFDTPALFDFGLAVPPPVDVQGDDWAGRVESAITPCDEITHTEHGYDDTPDYDKFWTERDYLKDADEIRIPVMVVHNWGDYNVKQEEGWNLFNALKNSANRKMFFGERYSGHGVPGGAYNKTLHAWMDHYLKGVDNGVEDIPTITSQTADFFGPGKFLSADKVKTRDIELIAQETTKTTPTDYEWKLLPTKPQMGFQAPTPATWLSMGGNLESHMNHHARSHHEWWYFESPPLKKDTRIFGEIKVKAWVTADREWVTLTPTILDINPGCHRTEANQHVVNPTPECNPRSFYSVTRGFLDSRYRDGLAKQKLVTPNQSFQMTVVQKPTDYTFKKGHQIGLQVAGEIIEWHVPKVYPCQSDVCANIKLDWENGQTRVVLPVVNGPRNPMDLFDFGGHHH